jgi:hypothetical protein
VRRRQELDTVVEIEAIVRSAEGREHRGGGQEPPVIRRKRNYDDRSDQHADDHRDSTHARNRDGVYLAHSGFVDDAPTGCRPSEHGQPRHGDDHGQKEGHDVYHAA